MIEKYIRYLNLPLITVLFFTVVQLCHAQAPKYSVFANDTGVADYQCYWMENFSGKYQYVPTIDYLGVDYTLKRCHATDSCSGGLGYSGGGCYKWAQSATYPAVPWHTLLRKNNRGQYEALPANLSLHQLGDELSNLPYASKLNGIAFSFSANNYLDKNWWVFMPGSFKLDEIAYDFSDNTYIDGGWQADIADSFDKKTVPKTSPLADAIIHSLNENSLNLAGENFIDILHLAGGDGSFFEDNPNIVKHIADLLATHKDINFTIRYLEGSPGESKVDGNKNSIAKLLSSLSDEYPGRVDLYFGSLKSQLVVSKKVKKKVAATYLKKINGVFSSLKRTEHLNREDAHMVFSKVHNIIPNVVNFALSFPNISWNHSKIFAVNNKTAIFGGANFWNEYKQGSTSPFDLAATIHGQAAIDSHNFSNALWRYVANTDNSSISSCQHYQHGTFFNTHNPPIYKEHFYEKNKLSDNTIKALTVNTLGPLHIESKSNNVAYGSIDIDKYLYPISDIIVNIMYSYLEKHDRLDIFPLISPIFYDVAKNAYYAERHARNFAIANASSSIKLSQQKFVLNDLMDNEHYRNFVSSVNNKLKIDWNGYIWPYDLANSLSKSLIKKSFNSLEIVASIFQGSSGYNDPARSSDFIDRVLLFTGGQLNTVDNKITYKRTHGGSYNHSKLVLIDSEVKDRALLKIGSENSYVSYNQQFNVWIADETAINNFVRNYWEPLWNYSVIEDY